MNEEMTIHKFCLFFIFLLLIYSSEIFAIESSFSKEEPDKSDFLQQKSDNNKAGKGLFFQPHKLNYFILNGFPGEASSQIKFQISAKYQVFEGDFNKTLPLYFAYTQKSFWNIGQPSAPFEENNYNPELFLDYKINENPQKLKHTILGLEHESNGRGGIESRGWNRLYVQFSFGIDEKELGKKGPFHPEKYSAYLKLWQAFSYEDQNNYLQAVGKDESFLDYAGRGEIGVSLRELPIISDYKWLKNNQLDFVTRIFRDLDKESYEIGYHQNIPNTNFFLYIQYWKGFVESLQSFDQRQSRFKAGLSFFY